jgi:large subunit ribosomal protein L28
MSRVCELCGKGPSYGNRVSHSNRKSRRRWLPNLQQVSLLLQGKRKSVRACTRCLRSYKTRLAAQA